MSFKNLLDLRKKVNPQVTIVERIIFQKRSLKKDFFLAFSVIIVASTIIWGITKADTIVQSFSRSQIKNFSVVGTVLNIDPTNIYIDEAKGSDDVGKSTYTLDLSTVTNVETDQYVPISLSDIKIGAKIVAQGQEDGGNIYIKRIVYFDVVSPKEPITPTPENIDEQNLKTEASASTTSATQSTESTTQSAQSSNEPVSTSTEPITSTSTTEVGTSSTIIEVVTDTITNTVNDVKDIVVDIVESVIETVTGNSGDTTNEQTQSSTTDPVINDVPNPEPLLNSTSTS